MRLWQNYRILTAARPGKPLQNYRILDAEKLAKFAEMIANIRENIRKRDYFSQRNRCFFSIRKFCKVYGNFVKYNEVLSSIHKFCHCWIVWLSNCGFFRTDKFVTDALGNPPFRQKTAIFVDKTASVCYTRVMRKRLDSVSDSADARTAATRRYVERQNYCSLRANWICRIDCEYWKKRLKTWRFPLK